MRIYNISGRACLGTGSGAVDIEIASSGTFSADCRAFTPDGMSSLHGRQISTARRRAIEESELASPVPLPPQISS